MRSTIELTEEEVVALLETNKVVHLLEFRGALSRGGDLCCGSHDTDLWSGELFDESEDYSVW